MRYIKLKELKVSGPDVIESSIQFGNKVTIIAGPSDSGKSSVYRCIDYIFGGSNDEDHLPLDEQDGYDTISLEILTDKGKLVLTRKLKSNITEVQSEIDSIESGDYALTISKKYDKTINQLFLTLLEVPIDLKLPSNDKGETQSFTWRNLKQAFLIDENRADNSKSIILPPQGQPLFIASLLYLITGDELNAYKGDKESEIIKKTRKNTLIEYIKSQREILKNNKANLESMMSVSAEEESIEAKIQKLNDKLSSVTRDIDTITNENKEISHYTILLQNRLFKNKAMMARYDELHSQYSTDINRLTFIVDNEDIIKSKSKNSTCPFCESSITHIDRSSYTQASQAELVKVIQKANELEDAKVELIDQIDDDIAELSDLKERSLEISKIINSDLIPQREQITSSIREYSEFMQIQGKMIYLNESDKKLQEDQDKYELEPTTEFTAFNSREKLYDLISKDITTYSKEILKEIGYPVETLEFNRKTLDLVLNKKRKNARGKGYKAFTNSVFLLAFKKLMSENAKTNPHLYVFDSPLKSLSLPEGDNTTKNIRAGYFQYVINNTNSDQVIIIENTNNHEIPELPSDDNVKIYKFTLNDKKGRYGFLSSLRGK